MRAQPRWLAALADRVRSARSANPWRHLSGREPVAIGELISPLRYDVVVRADYFDFCETRLAAAERDLAGHVAASRAHAYFRWFRDVACALRMPQLLDDGPALERAFAERVARTLALLRDWRARGFAPGSLLTLDTGETLLASDTGKRVAGPLFAGDGCHRLALLLRAGVATLEPERYRVRVFRSFAPRDATARLLEAGVVEPRAYFEFLSLGYSAQRFASAGALLADVRAHRADRLAELEALLAADAPRLAQTARVSALSGPRA